MIKLDIMLDKEKYKKYRDSIKRACAALDKEPNISFGNRLREHVNQFLGINSPSRIFAEEVKRGLDEYRIMRDIEKLIEQREKERKQFTNLMYQTDRWANKKVETLLIYEIYEFLTEGKMVEETQKLAADFKIEIFAQYRCDFSGEVHIVIFINHKPYVLCEQELNSGWGFVEPEEAKEIFFNPTSETFICPECLEKLIKFEKLDA